ncbi:MAG: TerC family protein [Planctomycetota bacterium]|jgi:predicted tellurium resistance membrane protein TerC
MPELISIDSLVALLTLTALEIVLGVDNIVFIAILTGRLDPAVRGKAQKLGLLGAMVTRILLLLAISWIMRLTAPLFTVVAQTFSGKDLILLAGGLFLIGKSTFEIHHKLEAHTEGDKPGKRASSFGAAIFQIMLLDIVFSLDSVITAVGMARHIAIMIAAVITAVAVMLLFAGAISRFVERHPTLKMLALSFLLLIGVMLVAEGLHQHIDKGYIYFAMAFSLFVELLNLKIIKRHAAAVAAESEAPPG